MQAQVLPNLDYSGELPFIGGALGYFSYDLGRRVERMPSLAKQDLVTPDMAIGLYDWALIVDHKEKSAYVVGSDTEEKWQWFTAQQEDKIEAFELRGGRQGA